MLPSSMLQTHVIPVTMDIQHTRRQIRLNLAFSLVLRNLRMSQNHALARHVREEHALVEWQLFHVVTFVGVPKMAVKTLQDELIMSKVDQY